MISTSMSSRKVIIAVDIFKYKYNHNIRANIETITNNNVYIQYAKTQKTKVLYTIKCLSSYEIA